MFSVATWTQQKMEKLQKLVNQCGNILSILPMKLQSKMSPLLYIPYLWLLMCLGMAYCLPEYQWKQLGKQWAFTCEGVVTIVTVTCEGCHLKSLSDIGYCATPTTSPVKLLQVQWNNYKSTKPFTHQPQVHETITTSTIRPVKMLQFHWNHYKSCESVTSPAQRVKSLPAPSPVKSLTAPSPVKSLTAPSQVKPSPHLTQVQWNHYYTCPRSSETITLQFLI